MFEMVFIFVENLLIGQLPDAVGLMIFGVLMIGTSVALRRLVGKDATAEQEEARVEDGI